MKLKTYSLALIMSFAVVGCSQSDDSCSDLEGTITHSTIEITGIESASVFKRNDNSNVLEAVDQSNGTEFSNLIVGIELSWNEEEHRFRATNTFLQSFLDWFIAPVMACSLAPYYEEYQPDVSNLQIFSDSDINADYVAGADLTRLFTATDAMSGSNLLVEDADGGSIESARSYLLEPAWMGGELTTIPTTPSQHIFTIIISLDDGRAFETRTPEVLLSGT